MLICLHTVDTDEVSVHDRVMKYLRRRSIGTLASSFALAALTLGLWIAPAAPAEATSCSTRFTSIGFVSTEDGRYLRFAATTSCPVYSVEHLSLYFYASVNGRPHSFGGSPWLARHCASGVSTCSYYGSIRDYSGVQTYVVQAQGERNSASWDRRVAGTTETIRTLRG